MRIQVSEAAPRVIDYFTACSQGLCFDATADAIPAYTADPALAAPIISALRLRNLNMHEDEERQAGIASIDLSPYQHCQHYGKTALIAALRCHLTVAYGNFLEVPDELIDDQLNYRNLWSSSARCAE